MILHPAILALLLGGLVVNLLLLVAARVGWLVMRHWEPESADERQLTLERRADLVTSLAHYALAFSMLSLPLFVLTAERLHPLFVGAMCATGTLNAAPYGWDVLWIKLWIFFLGGLWVVANHYDRQVESAPLLRPKYRALALLVPLSLLDLLLTFLFFSGLRPKVITSCCGSLFSSGAGNLASEVASVEPALMLPLFLASGGLYLLTLLLSLRSQRPVFNLLASTLAIAFFIVSLMSILSFISLYVYQLPTHHCPFDMLQSGYDFIGYPLYIGLFGTTLCGLVPGLLQLLSRVPGMREVALPSVRRWVLAALVFATCFFLVAAWPMLFGPLKLF